MTKAKKNINIVWIILSVTFFNAFLMLFVLGLANKELAGDEIQYNQLTLNLIHHSAFSFENEPPFEPTLYRTPGYPLFMALIYLISGNSVILVKVFQFLLFGASAYFLYQLAGFYVEEKTARIAAYCFLGYLPIISWTGYLYTEPLTIFLLLSLFLLIKKYDWENTSRFSADMLIGIVMGILAMVRPTSMLIVIPLVLSLWLPLFLKKSSLSLQQILAKSFLFGMGILLIFAPWIIRNYTITNRFIPLTIMTASESFYVSLLQYNGKLSYAFTLSEWQTIYLAGLSKRRSEAAEKISQGNLDAGLVNLPQTIQKEMLIEESYKNSAKDELKEVRLINIIKSLPIRLAYLWSTADALPNNLLHRISQVQFLAFFALAVIGFCLSWRKLLSHWLLLLFPIYLTLMHSIFHEEPRYTIPARPFILIYCAIAIVWLWNRLKVWSNKDVKEN